ncbi:flavodoxin family protein [Terrilactibacillus laevilacticus]|uniref:Flavodoxin family protein n=1 Tax=Terrilactibacillus laevilacticus TaxID=1380157 RepID=A0ABW5PUL9_9BACI|nr:flavodoxin family protein [Terrilactibacillus laevilacticus]
MLIIDGNSRDNGNTQTLLHLLLDNIPHEYIALRDKEIHPIIDARHTAEGFQPVKDDYQPIIKQVLENDIIILSTPIYWYGMSGLMKNFIDRWSQSMRDPSLNFKQGMYKKKMYVVTVGGDEPKTKGLPLIMQFQYIFDFVGASFEGYILGKGNKPGDVLEDQETMNQVKFYRQVFNRL